MEKITCLECGKKKGMFEKFTTNGFCLPCSKKLHKMIDEGKLKINNLVQLIHDNPQNRSDPETIETAKNGLDLIQALEELRRRVPFFKSSLEEQRTFFENVLQEAEKRKALKPKIEVPQIIDRCILKYRYDAVEVHGVSYANPDFSKIEAGALVEFEQEPENPVDPKAVKILSKGQWLGYVPDNRLKCMVNDWKKYNRPLFSFISRYSSEAETVHFFIGFYKNPIENICQMNHQTVKLIRTNKDEHEPWGDRQYNLTTVHEGDFVLFEADDEEKTLIAHTIDGGDLGELSKSISQALLEDGYSDAVGIVKEVTNSDSGILGLKLDLYY